MNKRKIFKNLDTDRWQDREEKAEKLLNYLADCKRRENEAYSATRSDPKNKQADKMYIAANAALSAVVEVLDILEIYTDVCEMEGDAGSV